MKIFLYCFFTLIFSQSILSQVPVINSFSPANGPIGTTVTISGNNFSASATGNTVFFGAVKATVTASSVTSLNITVPFGATYQPITITVNGLTAYAAKPFTVTFPGGGIPFDQKSFAPKKDFVTGTGPACVIAADVDLDGKPDLVVVNDTANTVSVFRNISSSGTIALTARTDFATGNKPYCVAAGDLDGDGKPDIAVANEASNTISVFRNLSTAPGDILFSSKMDLPTASSTFSVIITDLDGDGKPDLASTNGNNNSISVFKNNSVPGTLSFLTKADFATGVFPLWLAAGDLDGDGRPEIATANSAFSNSVSVLRNTSISGSISFATKIDVNGGGYSNSVIMADMDSDGKLDLAVSGEGSATTAVILNNTSAPGNILFGRTYYSNSASTSFGITAGDMDGDSKPDIVVATNNLFNTIAVFRNTTNSGFPGFDQREDFKVGQNPWATVAVDLDGDGRPDIASANQKSSNISVLRNKTGDLRIDSFDPVSGGNGSLVNITGRNFDSIISVLFGNIPASRFTVLSPTKIVATIASGSSGNITVSGSKGTDSIGGFIFDSVPLIASFHPAVGGTGTVVNISGVNFNTITGVFFGNAPAASYIINSPTSVSAVIGAVDSLIMGVKVVNPTGTAFLTGFYSGPSISSFSPASGPGGTLVTINGFHFSPDISKNIVHFGAAKGTVMQASGNMLKVIIPATATFEPITVSVDSLICNSDAPFIITFPQGSGGLNANSFVLQGDSITGDNPKSIAKADFDGDGKTDLVTLNYMDPSFSIFKNTGKPGYISFAPKVDYPVYSYPVKVITGDIDADGKIDVMVLNGNANSFTIFKNISSTGVISFATGQEIAILYAATDILLQDMDIDGKPDAIYIEGSYQRISISKNISTAGTIAFDYKVDMYPLNTSNFAVTDINRDGKPDIVLGGTGQTFTVLKNNCISGQRFVFTQFEQESFGSTGANAQDVAVADFDQNGLTDVVLANKESQSISVNTNSSSLQDINFSSKLDYPFGNNTSNSNQLTLSVADMDGDGKTDLVFPGSSNNNFVLKNNSLPGTISFMLPINCFTGYQTGPGGQMCIADLDGDGKPDIAGVNEQGNRVYFLRNRAGESIAMCSESDMILNTNLTGLAYQWQLNTGNGFTDLAEDIHYTNTKTASLQLHNISSAAYGNEYRCVVDGDRDTPLSLIFVNYWTGSVSTDWSNPDNWSCHKVPSGNTDVVINSGSVIVSLNVTVRSLLIKPSGSLVVNAGYHLNVLH